MSDTELRPLAKATISGVQSLTKPGGKFGHGFASTFASAFVGGTNLIGGEGAEKAIARTFIVGTIGGATSQALGDKFINGAITSSFAHVLNTESRKNSGRSRPITAQDQKNLDEENSLQFYSLREEKYARAGLGFSCLIDLEQCGDIYNTLSYGEKYLAVKGNSLAKKAYQGDPKNFQSALKQLNIDIAKNYARYVQHDHSGIPHHLSKQDIDHLHMQPFKDNNFDFYYYGGNYFENRLGVIGLGDYGRLEDNNFAKHYYCSNCDPVSMTSHPP